MTSNYSKSPYFVHKNILMKSHIFGAFCRSGFLYEKLFRVTYILQIRVGLILQSKSCQNLLFGQKNRLYYIVCSPIWSWKEENFFERNFLSILSYFGGLLKATANLIKLLRSFFCSSVQLLTFFLGGFSTFRLSNWSKLSTHWTKNAFFKPFPSHSLSVWSITSR